MDSTGKTRGETSSSTGDMLDHLSKRERTNKETKKKKHKAKTQQCLKGFQTTITLFGTKKAYTFKMCFRRDYGTFYGKSK